MSQLRLTYFNFAGRAHPIRCLLAAAGIPFEDHRIEFEEWGNTCGDQALYPQGTVPVLEVDGKHRLGDMAAILAYAGQRGGFFPTDPFAFGRVIEINAYIEAIYTNDEAAMCFRTSMRLECTEEKIKARQGPFPATVRYYLGCIDRIVSDTPGFAVGDKRTVADFALENVLSHLQCKDIDFFDDAFIANEFPKLIKIQQAVKEIPAVAELYAKGLGY